MMDTGSEKETTSTNAAKKMNAADMMSVVMAISKMTKDSYANPSAKLGAGQPNLVNAAEYPIQRLTKDYALMTSLYRNDWICKRIIDTPAEDMTREWIKITSQMDPDAIKRMETVIRRTRVRDSIKRALKWARLYGGAACIMMIAGQEDRMDQPLNLDTIMPDTFCGLIVLDRWEGITPTGDLITDMRNPDFGKPMYYQIGGAAFGGTSLRVHHSRILKFVGRELPTIEEQTEEGWGAAEMEHIFDELNKRNTSSANIAQLLFQANIRIMKSGDLAERLATMDSEALQEVYAVAQAQNELMSSFGIQFMDNDDSFETHQYTFTGISDVYKTFMNDIAGASEIPATKLFGRSPEGMNSTGESDLTNYYDSINQKQESSLRPVLEKLLPVVCVSTFGVLPDDFDFEFNPVRTSSEAARATLGQQMTAAILSAYNADVIDKATAMQELRKSSSETGMFTSITDEQIASAKDEIGMMAEGMEVPGASEIQPDAQTHSEPDVTDAFDDMVYEAQGCTVADAKEEWRTTKNGKHYAIGEGGKITKGPKAMKGKNVSSYRQNTPTQKRTEGEKEKKNVHNVNTFGSNKGENDFSAGFPGVKLNEHFKSKGKGVGAKNRTEYNRMAILFGRQKVGGNIIGCRDRNGQIVRFDKTNGCLFIGNPKSRRPLTFGLYKDGDTQKAYEYVIRKYPDIEKEE